MNSYVFPCSKRAGSYFVRIPTVWSEKATDSEYFSTSRYQSPKASAETYVKAQLAFIYGDTRAALILAYPQWVKKLKYGCQVSVRETQRVSRGKPYPVFNVSWTEFTSDEFGVRTSKRKRTSRSYNVENKAEVAHNVTLFVASLRAEATASVLHHSALNFEYDLSELTRS